MQCFCNAFIQNDTGKDITCVTLIHKFGDDPAQILTWGEVKDRWMSDSNPVPVSYRTGFGNMTSYDWWSVSWRAGDVVYTSNPSAFGYFMGFIAGIGAGLISATGTIVKPTVGTGAGVGLASAVTAASYATQLAVGSTAGTKELKEHMLHEEDMENGITVILERVKRGKEGEVQAVLETGDRRTVMACTAAKLPPYVEAENVPEL